jgi:predicted HAD superfamily Cof-like phosphohydrolase
MVQEFHAAFGCVTDEQWSVQLGALRARLIVEECDELGWALLSGDRLAIAQELADLAYVTIGAAVALGLSLKTTGTAEKASYGYAWSQCSRLAGALRVGDMAAVAALLPEVLRCLYGVAIAQGIDLDVAIAEVHAANMSKLDADGLPVVRGDGKVLKSDRYVAPNMSVALRNGSNKGT